MPKLRSLALATLLLLPTACDDVVDDGQVPLEVDLTTVDGKTDSAKNYTLFLAPTETKALTGTQTVGQFEAEVVSESDGGKDWMQIVGPVWRIDGSYRTVELQIDQIGSSLGISDDTTSTLAFLVMSRPLGSDAQWTTLEVEPSYDQLVTGQQSLTVKTFTRVQLDPRKGRFEATAIFEAGEHGFEVDKQELHRARLEYLVVPVPISTWWGVSLEGTWEYKMKASCDGKGC